MGACSVCLTRGRRLRALSAELGNKLIEAAAISPASQGLPMELLCEVPLCWECSALLRKSVALHERAARARLALCARSSVECIETSLSSLGEITKIGFDYEFEHEYVNPPSPTPSHDTCLSQELVWDPIVASNITFDYAEIETRLKELDEIDLNLEDCFENTNISNVTKDEDLQSIQSNVDNSKVKAVSSHLINVDEYISKTKEDQGNTVTKIGNDKKIHSVKNYIAIKSVDHISNDNCNRVKDHRNELVVSSIEDCTEANKLNDTSKQFNDTIDVLDSDECTSDEEIDISPNNTIRQATQEGFKQNIDEFRIIMRDLTKKPSELAKMKNPAFHPSLTIKRIEGDHIKEMKILKAKDLRSKILSLVKKKVGRPRKSAEKDKKFEKSLEKQLHSKTIVVSEEEMLRLRREQRRRPEYMNSPYKCEMCILPFTTKSSLLEHKMRKHAHEVGAHACDICQARFTSEERCARHRTSHYARRVATRAVCCCRCAHATQRNSCVVPAGCTAHCSPRERPH